jgi:thiazole synthase
MTAAADSFELGGKTYRSRLIVGTGKYKDFAETRAAIDAAGAEIVTVAVRRVNITDPNKENLLDRSTCRASPSCPTPPAATPPRDAIRTARLAREAGVGTW